MSIDAPRRILGFSSIRSDYDLLSTLYKGLHADPELDFGLVVSGAHLSHTYGNTVRQIESDELPIVMRIESLLDSNSPASRLKSAAVFLQAACDGVSDWAPDVLIFAGDREDAIMVALLGAFLRIPTVHFFGGDHADDANVDNPIRHACSKLATLHFVTHPEHQKRLQALGESAQRIHVIGNPALDRFIATPEIRREELCTSLDRPEWAQDDFALVIHHPILGYEELAGTYFEQVLEAIRQTGLRAFVSAPNTDAGNRRILDVIDQNRHDQTHFRFYRNLERKLFVNLLRHASLLVGNSSCGILEAPLLRRAVVNVGARQRGRLHAENVIFVDQDVPSITTAIERARSEEFHRILAEVESPYGTGDASEKAIRLLKTLDLKELVPKPEDPLAIATSFFHGTNSASLLSS